MTATHILFEKQVEYFKDKYNVIVWDAPGHGVSRTFELKFSLEDKAKYLHGILEVEKVEKMILIGQSMGGYVSQMFMDMYQGEIGGFISVDSCSLKRSTVTWFDIFAAKHVEIIYKMYNWEKLIKVGAKGCAESEYGRNLMEKMMRMYDKEWYVKLVGHGFKILAVGADLKIGVTGGIEVNHHYQISDPDIYAVGDAIEVTHFITNKNTRLILAGTA